MPNLVPEKWRHTLGRLREDIQRAVSRWWPIRRSAQGEGSEDRAVAWWGPAGLPAIEVEDTAETVEITAELPGLDKDDFHLEVVADYLVLRGEKKREHEERREGYWYSECAYGAFTRWIPLPCAVVPEKAQAKFRNGRLHVVLPKATPAKTIPVVAR